MRRYFVLLVLCTAFVSVALAQTEEIKQKDGTRIVLDKKKGIKTFYYSDGRVQKVDLNGKTPYGLAIEDVKVLIQKDPVLVDLKYSAAYSDELLIENAEKFFSKLAGALKNKKYNGKKPLHIAVSYCRYGMYGYCLDKQNIITVFISENKKITKKASVNTLELRDESACDSFITKVMSLY